MLPANWLLRSLEDRDYGIDAKIELFNGHDPTGNFFLIQIKGQEKPFSSTSPKKSIPTKTIEYALLFDVPFFVFLNSNESQKTKFVWLQRYVELVLNQENPNWRSKKSVTIKFPEINDLVDNKQKIEMCVRTEALRAFGLRFLGDYHWLELCHKESMQPPDLENMLLSVKRMLKLPEIFFDEYKVSFAVDDSIHEFDLTEMHAQLEMAVGGCFTSQFRTFIEHQVMHLDDIRTSFLTRNDADDFLLAHGGDENIPY